MDYALNNRGITGFDMQIMAFVGVTDGANVRDRVTVTVTVTVGASARTPTLRPRPN